MGLSVTKRRGERFWIGHNITVTVRSVDHDRATLCIDAPRDIIIRHDAAPAPAFRTFKWSCQTCGRCGEVHVENDACPSHAARTAVAVSADHARGACTKPALVVG